MSPSWCQPARRRPRLSRPTLLSPSLNSEVKPMREVPKPEQICPEVAERGDLRPLRATVGAIVARTGDFAFSEPMPTRKTHQAPASITWAPITRALQTLAAETRDTPTPGTRHSGPGH